MPLFQPITSPTQLPAAGHGAETYSFDIKQDIKKPFDSFELGKDVSAFANSTGGVILVGAAEDRKRGTIGRYLPLDEKDAKEIRDAYSTAVRDHCSPVPLINPVVLPQDSGHVVAVNVWPFPGQAVGVWQKSVPYAYGFPFRTGVDTKWLTAEQLPMLMVPEIRRVIILLDGIPEGSGVQLSSSAGYHWYSTLKAMSPLENALMLEVMIGEKIMPSSLPLDAIRSVWRDTTRGWCLAFQGSFTFLEGNKILIYKP